MSKKQLGKEELIKLVTKIIEAEGSEEEIDSCIETLRSNVPHPHINDLIFWNDNDDITPEEIVDQALAYKPIQL